METKTAESILAKHKPNAEYPSYYHEAQIIEMLEEALSPLSKVGEVTDAHLKEVIESFHIKATELSKSCPKNDVYQEKYVFLLEAHFEKLRSLLQPQPVNSEGKNCSVCGQAETDACKNGFHAVSSEGKKRLQQSCEGAKCQIKNCPICKNQMY